MTRRMRGWVIFGATVVFALGLYVCSAPEGRLESGLLGFTLSAVSAAVAGGLVGTLANRCFGWRIGTAAALVWVMTPGVWNRAVVGAPSVCLAAVGALILWLAYAGLSFMTRRARAHRLELLGAGGDMTAHGDAVRQRRGCRIVSRLLLGGAVAFAVNSALMHDSRIGEAAGVYARLMLDEAGDRIVVLNGVADRQMVREENRRNRAAGRTASNSRLLPLRTDAAFRTQLVARVRREWPTETNLWMAAEIGPAALAEELVRTRPERVYVMTGLSTTPEKWMARWVAMTPYFGSRDPFIPQMRRAFALEGNTLARRLREGGKTKEAWKLAWRVYDEIEPGNALALLDLNGMLRRGYAADGGIRRRIEQDLKERRLEDRLSGLRPDWQMLAAWNNEMIRAHGRGDVAAAETIARKILSKPEWRTFIPAHAVMGSALAQKGDLAEAELFFKAALRGKGTAAPQPAVMNDYADTLRKLGRYDEAERLARRAVAESGGKVKLYKITLAQILREAGKRPPAVSSKPPCRHATTICAISQWKWTRNKGAPHLASHHERAWQLREAHG